MGSMGHGIAKQNHKRASYVAQTFTLMRFVDVCCLVWNCLLFRLLFRLEFLFHFIPVHFLCVCVSVCIFLFVQVPLIYLSGPVLERKW